MSAVSSTRLHALLIYRKNKNQFWLADESLSSSVLAFVKSRDRGAESLPEEARLDAQAGLRIRIGLSGSQGVDMPNSEQWLAVKADERVLSEGSKN
jgi:hypothetical protein